MNLKPIIWLILLLGIGLHAHAQTKIQGILIDSTYNKVLEAAGVSVFEKGKTSVDKVTLTDRYGKFEISESAIGKPLILEFSLQGYEKVKLEFLLKANEKKDFGRINMKQVTTEIEAIDLIPPVRMNGDTIEFNADAFELDSNAVVEDLLNKLPGIVVWGDGAVTYNGRAVPTILVNGKPFFGSDMAIALQNIDKKAVKKLQVYDRRSDEEKQKEPDDKKMEMNVVLKEGKENMLFGNIGAGGGTDERYQGHLNMNKSIGKSQVTVAYSVNNVNKDLYNIDQLLRNTTFKGIGINADFDSDFLRQGILQQHVVGGRYQYDLQGSNQTFNQNLIQGNITARWNKNINQNESTSYLLNPEDSEHNTRSQESQNEQNYQIQNGSFRYNRSSNQNTADKRSFSYGANVDMENSRNDNLSQSKTLYDYFNNQSTNEIQNTNESNRQSLNVSANMNLSAKSSFFSADKNKTNFFDRLRYDLSMNASLSKDNNESESLGDYVNLINSDLNKSSNRTYDRLSNNRNMYFQLGINHTDFGFRQKISLNRSESDNQVFDLNGGILQENSSLTYNATFNQINYEPSLEYRRNLKNKYLNGRYYYSLNLTAELAARFQRNSDHSTLDYRNLDQNFSSFIPNMGLNYSYQKFGKYSLNQSIRYSYNEEYAYLDRLRPIYDDLYPGYRQYGATQALSPTGVHQVSANGGYFQQRQYALQLNYSANYKLYKRGLTDSLVYAENEQQNYTVQVPFDQHTFDLRVGFDKPFLIKKEHTLTMSLNANGGWGNKYQYIDGKTQEMINKRIGMNSRIYYTILNKFQIGWKNDLNYYDRYDNLAEDDKNDYSSTTWSTGLAAAYHITKRWAINSNLDNRSSFSKFQDNHALIWNANTTYRMLKGNNLEIKVAAFDLLKQNKGFYFNDGVTEFTSGYRNILTQYYMVSLSYMPRKFGK